MDFSSRQTGQITLWRGVKINLSDSFQKGKEYAWWALSSCTDSISVLEAPQFVGTSGPRTMFSIESSSGKSIKGMSYFQHENEILLPPGRYLKVVDKSSPATDLYIIHLREVAPPYEMLVEPFFTGNFQPALPHPNTVLPNPHPVLPPPVRYPNPGYNAPMRYATPMPPVAQPNVMLGYLDRRRPAKAGLDNILFKRKGNMSLYFIGIIE